MINGLDVPATDLWKYVDDTTISETIRKNQDSHIQAAVDNLVNRASADKFQLNVYYYTLYSQSVFSLGKSLQLILEISANYRLVSYLLADN